MARLADKQSVFEAYEDVRNDETQTNWLVLSFDENNDIVLNSTGVEFEEFQAKFTDEERMFGYLRIISGDEMSKRAKFVFLAWIGSKVSVLKKAKMATDKAVVKEVIRSFAVEQLVTDKNEIREPALRSAVAKAGGANYGTGSR